MDHSAFSQTNNSQKFHEALSLISKIENRVKLEDYMAEECNISFTRSSHKEGKPILMCNCPIHDETTPSFALYTHNQTYYCFACKSTGGLVSFVQNLNGWTWFETINFFATKLGISHNFTEADVKDMLERGFREKYQERVDIYNALNINFDVSLIGRDITSKYKSNKEINNYIEEIYKFTDRAIISKDKKKLSKIKEEMLPFLFRKVSEINNKELSLKELNFEHSRCNNCFLIHNSGSVVLGEGKPTAKVMIIRENPNRSNFAIKKVIQDLGFNLDNIWFDYIYSCKTNNNSFFFKEGLLCSSNWLKRKIDIIKPKAIMILGENAAKIFLKSENITLDKYLNIEINENGNLVSFNYDIYEDGHFEDFKRIIYNFLNKYIQNE